MHKLTWITAGSAALVSLASCSSPMDTPDAASGADSGSTTDASPTTDSGSPVDAASAVDAARPDSGTVPAFRHVFVVLMENHNWSDIHGSASAPYINGLLATGSHAEQYFNPPGIHPSEPNYLWLEAGSNFGVLNDLAPSVNHQSTTDHLVTQLEAAGVTWRSYQQGISGTTCPLTATGHYAPKHNPMIFFDDVTDTNSTTSARCIAHVRPYTELATDLAAGTTAQYNFITPDLCHDMHDSCAPTNDPIAQGDTWLSTEIPMILSSAAYADGGLILITWDESEMGDFPIGMIALSATVTPGYSNTIPYTHGSTLRTVEEIFGVPLLRDATTATDLSDLLGTTL
jgi:phospholipase C